MCIKKKKKNSHSEGTTETFGAQNEESGGEGLTSRELSGRIRMKRQRHGRWGVGAKEEAASVNGIGLDLLPAVTSGHLPPPSTNVDTFSVVETCSQGSASPLGKRQTFRRKVGPCHFWSRRASLS